MYDSEKKLLKSNFWNEDLDVLGFSKCYHPPLPAYKETTPNPWEQTQWTTESSDRAKWV